jgi:hypothetical protein
MLMWKKRSISIRFYDLIKLGWLGLLLTSGCIRLERISTETSTNAPTFLPSPSAVFGVTSTPNWGWEDVSYLMADVCFEAAANIAGNVFVLRDANALAQLYTQMDSSLLCEEAINRNSFVFSDDMVIAGLWSSGTGCTSQHDVQNVLRDDTKHQVTIQLQFVTDGDCSYELMQPFWVAIRNMAGTDIRIDVQR